MPPGDSVPAMLASRTQGARHSGGLFGKETRVYGDNNAGQQDGVSRLVPNIKCHVAGITCPWKELTMHHCGLDFSSRETAICIVDAEGTFFKGSENRARLSVEWHVIAIFAGEHLGEQRRCCEPARFRRSGAAACTTLLQTRPAYFGRVVRITRSLAGTQSSISEWLPPIRRIVPPQHGRASLGTSSEISSRGR